MENFFKKLFTGFSDQGAVPSNQVQKEKPAEARDPRVVAAEFASKSLTPDAQAALKKVQQSQVIKTTNEALKDPESLRSPIEDSK